jgi:hypothetical protein
MNQDRREKMQQATDYLDHEGIRYFQPSEYQIKVGRYNFWPCSGTICLDGASSREGQSGLHAFIAIVRRLKEKNPKAFQKKPERLDLREAC